jgi:sulfur-oxidizing protein SoxY
VMQVDVGVAISEDPYMRLFYLPDGPGVLEVTAEDNEGKSFTQSVDISG